MARRFPRIRLTVCAAAIAVLLAVLLGAPAPAPPGEGTAALEARAAGLRARLDEQSAVGVVAGGQQLGAIPPTTGPSPSSVRALPHPTSAPPTTRPPAPPSAAAATPPFMTPTALDTDIPALALRAYRYAENWAAGFDPACMLSWSVLAGIGRIESNHGRHFGALARFSPSGDVTPSILGPVLNGAPNMGAIHDTDRGRLDGDVFWDRAVGPMQFIPSTWQSVGRDGNNDGVANPNNLFDSSVSAAAYLCLAGGGPLTDAGNLLRAVYAYNHSWDYVAAVLSWANFYRQRAGEGVLVEVQVPSGPASSLPGGTRLPGTAAPPTSPTNPSTSPPSTTTTTTAPPSTSRSSTTTKAPTTTTRAPTTTKAPTTTTKATTTTKVPTTTTSGSSTTDGPSSSTTTSTTQPR